jgi:hypothetical protein
MEGIMTVSELIAHLKRFDPLLPVFMTYEGVMVRCSTNAVGFRAGWGSHADMVLIDAEKGDRLPGAAKRYFGDAK